MTLVRALARRFWWQLLVLAALEALGAGIALLAPIPLKVAVDLAAHETRHAPPAWVASAMDGRPDRIAALAVLSLIIALVNQAQGVGSGLLSTLVGQRLILTLRTRLFDAALRLSLRRHIQKGVADAVYRIQSDAQTVEWILLDGALPVFTAVVTLVAMLIALFRLNPLLGLVGIAIAPPLLTIARLLRPALKAGAKTARERESRALATVNETLGALPAVKAFGREDVEVRRFEELAGLGVKSRLWVAWLDGILSSGVQLLCATGTALALYIGVRAAQSGQMSLGDALLGINYVNQVYGPLKTLGRKWASLQTQIAGLERAMVLLNEPSDVPEAEDARPIERARGDLAFEGVGFAYDERRPVLQGVDLAIMAGQRVGIVGETGSGKTTLFQLLLRFYDPVEGRILLDGTDLRELRVADLRRQFAVVFQETVLFQGTVAENIAVGRPGATPEQIEGAARAANLHDAVLRLADGYETMVGERGHALSGGERQRVGLARAFLRDAPILILDEPTSALDASTEALVLEALGRLMEGRTVLIITHRLQALTGCDRVLRVADSRVTAEAA